MRYDVKAGARGGSTNSYSVTLRNGSPEDVVSAVLARLASTPKLPAPVAATERKPEPLPQKEPVAKFAMAKTETAKSKNEAFGRVDCKDHQRYKARVYHEPCLVCDMFCNCDSSYFSIKYPDVLVRSKDKQIVKLSGAMVASSALLRAKIGDLDVAFKSEAEGGFKTVNVVIKGKTNCSNSVIDYRVIGEETLLDESKGSAYCGPKRTNVAADSSVNDSEDSCSLEDIIENGVEKLLVLFDTESDRPTLGITKKTLMKVDYYISMHLDEVDDKVRAARRKIEYFRSSIYKEAPDLGCVNTFAYEDWEEDFFDIHPLEYFDLHQANQELLIWDLYLALEKWSKLNRGFPYGMVNGWLDIFEDPDYDYTDRREEYGYYNIPYRRRRRKRYTIPERQIRGHNGKLQHQYYEDKGSGNECEDTEIEGDGSTNVVEEDKTGPVPLPVPTPVTFKWWVVIAREFD